MSRSGLRNYCKDQSHLSDVHWSKYGLYEISACPDMLILCLGSMRHVLYRLLEAADCV